MITQVLDTSHEDWVLGGIFRDLRKASENFEISPQYLNSYRSINSILANVKTSHLLKNKDYLFFSSLTPLENYFKLVKLPKSKIGVWFTHLENQISRSQIRNLDKVDLIFVHSRNALEYLVMNGITSSRIKVVIGALDPNRFKSVANFGHKIAIVSTPNKRKNPLKILNLVKMLNSMEFTLFGKGWQNSDYWGDIISLENLTYLELAAPINYQDLSGHSIFVSLSQVEGGPMPLLECLAAGLTPYCTNTGFASDLLYPLGLEHNIIDSNASVEDIATLISTSQKDIFFNQESYRDFALQYTFEFLAKRISEVFLNN